MSKIQNPSNSNQQYLTQITLALNKIKTKLPINVGYRPDKHFEYLSNNTKSIKMETLHRIIPFKEQYKQFNPLTYLPTVLSRLNEGTTYNWNVSQNQREPAQLGYQGYIRLITTQRILPCRGSEVNITLFNRASLDHQINKIFENTAKINDANKKSDSIIGMILFLQCLKQAERAQAFKNGNKIPTFNNTHQHWNTMNTSNLYRQRLYDKYGLSPAQQRFSNQYKPNNDRYFYLDEEINNNKMSQPIRVTLDRSKYPYYYNDQGSKPRKSMITFGSPVQSHEDYNKRSNYPQRSNYYQGNDDNKWKPQFMRTMDTKYSKNPEEQNPITYQQTQRQFENDQRSRSAYPFLSRFSSKANIWKNIAERNWDYKTDFLKRSGNDSTAFIYEQNMMEKSHYTRMPQSPKQTSRLINKMDKSGYYTK